MNLIAPQNLFFGALLGVIVLLYMLKLRRQPRTVASTLLWPRALRDRQANAPWQKLRSSPLMWLQLAILALAVLALARPAITMLAGGGQTLAIVLDASASMGATDVSPSRFQAARAEAERLISGLGSEDAGTLILAGARTRVLSPLSSDKNALRRALNSAQVEDARCDLREALSLAASLLRGKRTAQIVVVSDGGTTPIASLPLENVGVQWVRVGQRNENVAITALDVARSYARGARPQLFATIANFGSQTRDLELELKRNGALIAARQISIPGAQSGKPGQNSQLFESLSFSDGLFELSFQADDDLESDNRAFATLAPTRTRQVLALSQNPFLERALSLDPSVVLARGAAADFVQAPQSRFDVVVCDGVAPPAGVSASNLLIFRATGEFSPVEELAGGDVARPEVVNWDRRHPVARGASWADLKIAQAQRVRLKGWGMALVEGVNSPLVVAGTRKISVAGRAQTQRVVWVGFDLRDSDFALRVAFPIFAVNALRWLSEGEAAGASSTFRPATPILLPLPDEARSVQITAPDGATSTLEASRRPFSFDGATRVGAYRAKAGDWSYGFGMSLLDAEESDLEPRVTLEVGADKPLSAQSRTRANRELWPIFALLALGLMALEWWIFHRGS